MASQGKPGGRKLDPIAWTTAGQRASVYALYWVCVGGLAFTASPAGLEHWRFWAIALCGVAGAAYWVFRPQPVEEVRPAPPTTGLPEFGPRRPVDTSEYRSNAVSAYRPAARPTGED